MLDVPCLGAHGSRLDVLELAGDDSAYLRLGCELSFKGIPKCFLGHVFFWRLGAPRPKPTHFPALSVFVGLAAEGGKANKPFFSSSYMVFWPRYPRPPKTTKKTLREASA